LADYQKAEVILLIYWRNSSRLFIKTIILTIKQGVVMLNFIRNSFKTCFEISLWLNLIACAICGSIIGGTIGKSSNLFTGASAGDGHPILGLILGAFVGMMINITYGGIVAVFLDMSEDLKALRKNSSNALSDKALQVDDLAMVSVEGGTFMMGCTSEQGDNCNDNEKLTVGSFNIGKYEVTQRLWRRVMGSLPSKFKGDDLPVENVSWDDIQKFVNKLNEQTGKKYRLPTEAEWEYAARGGNKSNGYKYSGSNNIDDVAWYDGNSGRETHNVGTKQPNELGIYDMSGNVCEWVSDLYGKCATGAQTNPIGSSSVSPRVIRGGSWGHDAGDCRVFGRINALPDFRNRDLGFRLVLSP
jgi:formylglycine-generating enzyme required for sulfatase activity